MLSARGELQTVGATTLDEYRKYLERDSALERRFQKITVDQPSLEECVQILKGLRDRYEAHHKVNITDEALEAAAELADRYISDRFLPDKAIDLIDEAASRMRIKSMSSPPVYRELEDEIESTRREKEAAIENQEFEKAAQLRDAERRLTNKSMSSPPVYRELEDEIESTRREKEAAIENQEFEKAAQLRDAERRLTNKKRELEDAWESGESGERPSIGEEEIADIVSMWTGIPVFKLTEAETQKLMRMEDELHKRVIGQDAAIEAVSKAIRRKPYSVLLLDEIEKAHPDVFNILLQILEDGRLTDAQGRTVDFRNSIVIMTSNVGAQEISKNTGIGFTVGDETGITYEDMKNRIMGELKKVFRPEFLNRSDEVIVFHKLTKEEIKSIVDLLLRRIRGSLAERELQLDLTEGAEDFLVDKGWDPAMGARPLRRAIQRYIEDPLADFVLRAELEPQATVLVEKAPEDDEQDLSLTVVKPEKKPTPVGVGGRKDGEPAEEP